MERLREAVAAEVFDNDHKSIQLTVSIGISSTETPGEISSDRLLDMADEALYKAKSGGRNRTVCYAPK